MTQLAVRPDTASTPVHTAPEPAADQVERPADAVVAASSAAADAGSTEDDAARRSNWLRAGVLGANDGIVSVAAIIVGVAGATSAQGPVVVAGLAALIGGAVSMALGEYVSVSSQRDSQRAARRGVRSHADASPWAAATASAVAFLSGGILPLLAVLLAPAPMRIIVTVVIVIIALAATGAAGARLGGARAVRPTLRTVIGGGGALLLTFLIGHLLGTSGVV